MSEPRRPPEDQAVFFVDRCLGSVVVPTALRAAGLRIEIHDSHFGQSETDIDWLPVVGKRGWAVITEDKRIKTRILELAAMIQANTHVFVLNPVKRLAGRQKGAALAAAAEQMQSIVEHRSTPLLATVSPSGKVCEIQGYSSLQRMLEALGSTQDR